MFVRKHFFTCVCVATTLSVAASGVSEGEGEPVSQVSTQYYGLNRYDVAPVLPALRKVAAYADSLYRLGDLRRIGVTGTTSADGPYDLNAGLARNRAESVAQWIKHNKSVPDSLIETYTYLGTWDDVRNMLKSPGGSYEESPYCSTAVEAIDEGGGHDEIQARLKALSGGRVWEWLASEVLPKQRSTVVSVEGVKDSITAVLSESKESEPLEPERKEECIETIADEEETELVEDEDLWTRGLYIKTNLPAWAMLWTNVAAEVDLGKHWSFALPVYYSGFNYFSGKTKFRTLALQPEVRWWVKADNTGFFAGAHFGLGWYNCAFGGENRYQDHNRRTPAIGGGLAVGYRFYFCSNRRWQMEASIGAGVYRLDYDVFENKHNGLITDRRKRTFYGIDQAAFTISYRFDLSGKGGAR